MNKKLPKAFAIAIISMLLLSISPVFAWPPPTKSYAADSMWVEPDVSLSTAMHAPPYRFNLTIYLNVTTDNTYQYQIAFLYNRTLLKCTGAGFTAAPTSEFMQGHATTALITIDTSFLGNGSVLVTEALTGADQIPPPRMASLVWIEMEVLKAPGKYGVFNDLFDISSNFPSNTWVWNPAGTNILDAAYDATYTYTWAPPTTIPHFAVDPLLVEYGPDPPSAIGEAFNIDVYLENVDVGWDITNASLCLCYNTTVIDVIGGAANVTINTALWAGPNSVAVIHSTPWDYVSIIVRNPTSTPSLDVLIATITFTVMMQQDSPPAPAGTYDDSPLTFCNYTVWDHEREIATDDPENGLVKIYALRTLPLAWLEVIDPTDGDHEVVMGPEPCIGEEFEVDVIVKNLDHAWKMIYTQFRLLYDESLIEFVDAEEGPFLQDSRWNLFGTYFFAFYDNVPQYGPHVIVFDGLMPNATTGNYDQTEFPQAEGPDVPPLDPPADPVVATLTFKVLHQSYPFNYTTPLDLVAFWEDGDSAFIDVNGDLIPSDYPMYENGTVTIRADYMPGRVIDVFTQYPAPFGGQGLGMPSDMFWPQKEVILYANVTYNYWPVQQKLVTFTVYDPSGYIWTQLQGLTNGNGTACTSFRIPWPCDNPEELIGVWRVEASVDIACIVVNDTLEFHFDYLINIVDVDAEPFEVAHCEYLTVTVTFTSHAQQEYLAAIRVTIHDELNVPVATSWINFTIGGAEYCTPSEYIEVFELHIPKFAAAGEATVYVVPLFYWDGVWTAAGPDATTIVWIQPWWA